MQVYSAIASQFYVKVNVESYVHAFVHLHCGEKRRSSIELSKNISDRSEASGKGIMSDLLLNKRSEVSGKFSRFILNYSSKRYRFCPIQAIEAGILMMETFISTFFR